MAARIHIRERTKIDRHVRIEAGKPDPQLVEHLTAQDIIDFAKALEQAQAPPKEQVRATMQRQDGYLVKSLAVYWSQDKDLVDGEPAPQAVEVSDAS